MSAPAAAIYPVISTARGWAQWWAADVTETGPAIELGFFHRATVYRLQSVAQEPPVRSEWWCERGKEWAGTRISFRLETAATGSLRFAHSDWSADTEYFLSCNTTWGEFMFRIKSSAEGKPQGPRFLADSLAD
jgi:hypothetical protein